LEIAFIIFGVFFIIIIISKISNAFKENEELRSNTNSLNYNLSEIKKKLELKEREFQTLRIQGQQEVFKLQNEINRLKEQLDVYKKNYTNVNISLEQITEEYNILKSNEKSHQDWLSYQERIKEDILNVIETNLTDRVSSYKWLSPLVTDAKMVLIEKLRDNSELIKSKRDNVSMARVNVLINEKRFLLEENIILKYQLEYIKTLIPEVEDIIEYDEYLNESLEDDSPKNFLSKEEYDLLSETEKNIRALEYYKKRKKRNWEIGRDFERYIGYLFEQEGYTVEYYGIEKKLNDLGRDLIVKKDNLTTIIQCKYWSKNKTIHEKHIAQLFGTVAKYKIDNPNEKNVIGLFVSHTVLSDEAKNFASALGIHVLENRELGEYPLIKCNIGRDKNGYKTYIYHLPMDQQYDSTIIDKLNGDFYTFTIEEAEKKGFRRAYKWHGN